MPRKPHSFFGLTPPPGQTTRSGSLLIGPDGCVLPTPAALARIKLRASLSEDTCCSFDEWKDSGYWIRRGAKSCFTDIQGVPQFTAEQTFKPSRRW